MTPIFDILTAMPPLEELLNHWQASFDLETLSFLSTWDSYDAIDKQIFSIRQDGVLASCLAVMAAKVLDRRGVETRIACLGGVSTRPKSRRQGLATKLVSYASEWIREQQFDYGLLFTDNPHFYKNAGWEAVDVPVSQWHLKAKAVPSTPVQLGRWAYELHCADKSPLKAIRSETAWEQRINQPREFWKSRTCFGQPGEYYLVLENTGAHWIVTEWITASHSQDQMRERLAGALTAVGGTEVWVPWGCTPSILDPGEQFFSLGSTIALNGGSVLPVQRNLKQITDEFHRNGAWFSPIDGF